MTPLVALAKAAGLQVEWSDAAGQHQRVADAALVEILAALDFPADSTAAIADSRASLARAAAEPPQFVSADVGRAIHVAALPTAGPARLVDEAGRHHDIVVDDGGRLPAIADPGYYSLLIGDRDIGLAVAPRQCFRVSDAAPGRRLWGPAVQISALRDDHGGDFGDFATLAAAATAFSARGADAVAISPVHALFPADASRYSPYAPSSRLFLNALYADPGSIGEPALSAPQPGLIDWAAAIPARMAALRTAFDRRGDAVRTAVAAFTQAGGDDLERHARFDALHAHFFARTGAHGWQDWPAEFHDASGAAVAAFAGAHADEIEFYRFVQYLADQGLAGAQAAAKAGGMAIGLITDLAVGMDAGGSHAWSRPSDLLSGLSIGAPPDLLGPDGQNWGITGFAPHALARSGFAPFIATLRSALRHAGGIRIDHAMGLARLWVVPDGKSAADGAYLTYPLTDQLRLLALESHRAGAVVIGEDLGTVPAGFRPAIADKAVLGMQVLWFERDDEGDFTPPAAWRADATAMTGTHDLPTAAGWWRGRDLDWAARLGRSDQEKERTQRDLDRTRLWQAFVAAGAATEPAPALDDGDRVADAALVYVGATPAPLVIVPVEDVVGLVEQPNLPGTIDEHPNWRRRLPDTTTTLLGQPAIASRLAALETARRR